MQSLFDSRFYVLDFDTSPSAFTPTITPTFILTTITPSVLTGSPEYIIGDIREEIMQKWGQGMQEERRHHGAYEFKLRGNPWWASGTETTESR